MLRSYASMIRIALLLAIVVAVGAAGSLATAQDSTPAAAPDSFTVFGLVENPATLTVADLQEFPAETVEVTFLSSGEETTRTFTGTRFWDFLDSLGIVIPGDARNGQLALVVRLIATDDYVVVISLGEIDPGFGATPLLLAWEEDGEALALPRLVVPGDIRGGRYITDVISIEVLALP